MPPYGPVSSAGVDTELTRMIARLTTQRAYLDLAAMLVANVPGAVFELGLGKARTYDHLRRLLPSRELVVFDRELHAPAHLAPPSKQLWLGDFRETLARAANRHRGRVALIHADIGSVDRSADAALVRELLPLLRVLLCERGVLLGDREMNAVAWTRMTGPADAGHWPYYLYRVQP